MAGLAIVAIVVGVLASTGSISAICCCAATHGRCARLKTPDDCCRSMGHVVSALDATVPSHAHNAFNAPDVVPAFLPGAFAHHLQTPPSARSQERFTRPHDPPHLQSTPLLI